jgi:hypothetical protein
MTIKQLSILLDKHEPAGTCYCYVEGWIAALETLADGQGTWASSGPIGRLLDQGYTYRNGED